MVERMLVNLVVEQQFPGGTAEMFRKKDHKKPLIEGHELTTLLAQIN